MCSSRSIPDQKHPVQRYNHGQGATKMARVRDGYNLPQTPLFARGLKIRIVRTRGGPEEVRRERFGAQRRSPSDSW
ncbi:hypothetical protein GWI33_000265 [Rhynchophorus ferrugineus]|uniref:Uncharacterized protein n=1 Tax=Rhynchophorus ferrugineus TaxID=354439 RepID=A0A834ML86_RHYFE|nr:hypothetical protein GWI33_000265 [Rhynchophorus ferrugineus]